MLEEKPDDYRWIMNNNCFFTFFFTFSFSKLYFFFLFSFKKYSGKERGKFHFLSPPPPGPMSFMNYPHFPKKKKHIYIRNKTPPFPHFIFYPFFFLQQLIQHYCRLYSIVHDYSVKSREYARFELWDLRFEIFVFFFSFFSFPPLLPCNRVRMIALLAWLAPPSRYVCIITCIHRFGLALGKTHM